jgi:putative transposase
VPTAQLRVLFVLVILAHHRRRVLHFNVTEHPTAAWTAQQIVDTFPDDSAPSYLLRDRGAIYGDSFRQCMKGMRIQEVLTAARSPWQNAYAERFVRSIREECLDCLIFFGERRLFRALAEFVAHYHGERNHQGLGNELITPAAAVAGATRVRCRDRLGGLLRYYHRAA